MKKRVPRLNSHLSLQADNTLTFHLVDTTLAASHRPCPFRHYTVSLPLHLCARQGSADYSVAVTLNELPSAPSPPSCGTFKLSGSMTCPRGFSGITCHISPFLFPWSQPPLTWPLERIRQHESVNSQLIGSTLKFAATERDGLPVHFVILSSFLSAFAAGYPPSVNFAFRNLIT